MGAVAAVLIRPLHNRAFRRTYGDLHVSCDFHFWMCNHQIGKGIVVTDATYWTERVEATRVRVLKNFVGFGTCRACNFPIIPVDVLPREVVATDATTLLHTAKIHLILAPHGSTSPFRMVPVRFLLSR